MAEGHWVPTMQVLMVNHPAIQKPIGTIIPICLCDNHKIEAERNNEPTLGAYAKKKLELMVAMKYRQRLNWDTMRIVWSQIKGDKVKERLH